MSAFIRRFNYNPGADVLTLIEGISIVSLAPPGAVTGANTGVVVCVGEFADCTHAVTVASTGNITSHCTPYEVYSPQELADRFGGFDSTIGKFGSDCGNGFAALRNKTFSRLVIAAVDLVCPTTNSGIQYGIRAWRDLPTNKSATDPTPIVPVQGGSIDAGREFKSGSNRVRVAGRVAFSSDPAYAQGVDGAVTAAGAPAASQTFGSAGALFQTGETPVQVGDIFVLGVLGAAGAQGSNAATYRVVSITSDVAVVLEKMNGATFDWTSGTSLAWRAHPGAAADTAGVAGVHVAVATATGYLVPARPLDASIAKATALTPTVVPTAGSATSWDVLSGLAAKTHPTGDATNGLIYDATIHAPNLANTSAIAARYQVALDALLVDAPPAGDVNIGFCARKYSTIRSATKAHTATARSRGLTRRWINAPELDEVTLATILGDSDPGVGANRLASLDFSWPGCVTYVPEAVGTSIACADGTTTTDGMLDDPFDGWLASIESNLPPERNPGQPAEPVPTLLAPVLGFQRGAPNLGMAEYIALRQKGVAALRIDRATGPQVQSGVTTSLVSGEKNISRNRMADYLEDSAAQRLAQFNKLPLTRALKDSAYGELDSWLSGLVSPNDPNAQRIDSYLLDDKSGNTPATTAAGLHTIIMKVRLTPNADFLVLQTQIGENVDTTA